MSKLFGKSTQIHDAWIKYLRNGLTMFEFDKRLKYVGNDVDMREMAEVFEKRLKFVGNDVDLFEIAKICRKQLIFLFNLSI